MPSAPSGMTSLQPPRPYVSDAAEENNRSERRETSTRLDSKAKEHGRSQASPEWVDVVDDNLASRRRKRTRRTAASRTAGGSSLGPHRRHQRQSITDIGRFLPKLSQILESSEPRSSQRHQSGEQPSSKRDRYADDDGSVASYRRPVRSKNISVQRRQDSRQRMNASLLSVISGLTTSTDRSSGSNSTLTQRSYSRSRGSPMYQDSPTSRSKSGASGRYPNLSRSSASLPRSSYSSSMRQYDDDTRSDVSTSTSTSLRSSAGASSILSGTPSSRSTYPSPTFSRDGQTANTASKPATYDGSTHSPHAHHESLNEHQQEPDNGELGSVVESSAYSGSDCGRSDTLYSTTSSLSPSQPQDFAAPMPTHPHVYAERYLEELHGGVSSAIPQDPGLAHLTIPRQMITAAPDHAIAEDALPHDDNGPAEHMVAAPPPAPEAPDAATKTLTGYELLASELCSTSTVKPLYRKFEFLNHRLLLHLQDELAELEEQLRTIDEIAAQMESDASGKRLPCSRRGDAYYGVDIHHHRTSLLGRIFLKTEQYNKAMSSYSTMSRDCIPAQPSQVAAYRAWMAEHNPIHEVETQFLRQEKDLIVFDQNGGTQHAPTTHTFTIMTGAPLIWCLSIALLAFAPTVLSRLGGVVVLITTVTTLIFTTRLRQALTLNEWLISIASYSFCFTALAICMPSRESVPNGL